MAVCWWRSIRFTENMFQSMRSLAKFCGWGRDGLGFPSLRTHYSTATVSSPFALTRIPESSLGAISNRPALPVIQEHFATPTASVTSEDDDELSTEYFIPVTRSSLLRYLIEEPKFLNGNEKNLLEQFSVRIDKIISTQFTGIQDELKNLFEPLNPDKATSQSRNWRTRDKMDMEFWLLQKLSVVLERANFNEIPAHIVDRLLNKKTKSLKVSVDMDKYAVLRFWALGREAVPVPVPWYEFLLKKYMADIIPYIRLTHKPPTYLKRVVAAVRLKGEERLHLKVFKDVPLHRLEFLLPKGSLVAHPTEKLFLGCSGFATGLGVLAQTVACLASIDVLWPIVSSFTSGSIFFLLWTRLKNKKMSFLSDLNTLHFFKIVANNKSLLQAIMDRAIGETFKEAIITYAFLVTQRPPSEHEKMSGKQSNKHGGINKDLLQKKVEAWAHRLFGVRVKFNADESIHLLESIGVLTRQQDLLYVMPLQAAVRSFPSPGTSLLTTSEESDVIEGYDKDIVFDDLYRQEKKLRQYKWC